MNNHTSGTDMKLLVLLIDGFRWDYFNKQGLELAGFNQLFRQGVKAECMVPDFPSLSYPNYYSIMTGKYLKYTGLYPDISIKLIFDHYRSLIEWQSIDETC